MSTAVVSTSRKKAPGKSASATTRYDNLPNVREPTHLMDAGGEGRSSLTLDAQATVQLDMYRRTLDLSDLFFRNKEQESRQVSLQEKSELSDFYRVRVVLSLKSKLNLW